MAKRIYNSKGFGVIELVIIVVAVGLLGFGGWYVWRAQNKDVKPAAPAADASRIPEGYKQYKNDQLGFIYPTDWIQQDMKENRDYWLTGSFAAFVSPEQDQEYKDFKASGRATEGPSRSSFVISKWASMNDDEAKGGSSIDDRNYLSLEDYLNDTQNTHRVKQKIGAIDLGGQKAYEITIGGFSQNYGVILERDGAIYELSFPTIYDKQSVTTEVSKIVESLKFY